MQKTLLILLSLSILSALKGQVAVDLQFKFLGLSPIVYEVTNRPENLDSLQISFFLEDSTSKWNSQSKNFLRETMKQQFSNDNYFIIRKTNDKKFLVEYTNSDTTNDIISLSKKFYAHIDNKGRNLSFYLSNTIDILTRLFFALPDKKVRIGDSWKLGVDLTDFAGLAKCDSSYKRDIVRVTNILRNNNDTLVTVNYDFEEYFKGFFYVPTESRIRYYGKAVFSLNRGLWIDYRCFKEMDISGFATSKSKEVYSLELSNNYPKFILQQHPE